MAIDLAAPYIRMARRWAELRNVSNVQFYQANAEDLSWLDSESFDFINYAYVLHEMPGGNAKNVISGEFFLRKFFFAGPQEKKKICEKVDNKIKQWRIF